MTYTRALNGADLLQIARNVGLREVIFNVSAERATPLLQAFFAEALATLRQQAGRVDVSDELVIRVWSGYIESRDKAMAEAGSKDPLVHMRAALTAALAQDTQGDTAGEPRGTFDCPVCGLDRPHHHSKDEAAIRWHSEYRAIFEGIVFNNLVYVPMDGIFIGPELALRALGGGSHLGLKAEDARHFSGKVIAGCAQNPWSEFRNARASDDGYALPWMETLWRVFKQTVIALNERPLYFHAERARVPDVECPHEWYPDTDVEVDGWFRCRLCDVSRQFPKAAPTQRAEVK